MKKTFVLLISLCFAPILSAEDWNQWRGPSRNGVLSGGPPLADQWPADGPAVLWDSDTRESLGQFVTYRRRS